MGILGTAVPRNVYKMQAAGQGVWAQRRYERVWKFFSILESLQKWCKRELCASGTRWQRAASSNGANPQKKYCVLTVSKVGVTKAYSKMPHMVLNMNVDELKLSTNLTKEVGNKRKPQLSFAHKTKFWVLSLDFIWIIYRLTLLFTWLLRVRKYSDG